MSDLFTNRNKSSRFWPGRTIQPNLTEINLRQEMHDLLWGTFSKPSRGHWMVYRRFDVTKKVEGYDDVYRTGPEVEAGQTRQPNYPYKDELVITRMDPRFNPILNEANAPMGVLPGGEYINYFEYNFTPYNYDQLFDIKWEDHRIKPPDSILNGVYERKYNIKEVFPYRSDGGRIEYWIAYTNWDLVNP